MKKLVSIFSVFAMVATLISGIIPLVHAAAPQGTLTGSVITVQNGQTKAITTLTVTDFSTAEITSANDIRIRIPAGVQATWDTSDLTATLGGTASAKASGTVSYPDSKTLLIDVTTNFANSDTLTIAGLSYIGTGSSTATALDWAIDGASLTYLAGNANTQITAVNVTLTGSIQTVDVGQISAINALTVTDDATTQVTATNDIRIKIPAGVNAVWDTSDLTTAAYTGTASAKASTTVSYPDTKTLLIDVTSSFTASQTLVITGLSYVGHTAASTAAALQYSYDGGTTYFTGNANTNITIASGTESTLTSASASVISSQLAGATAVSYTVAFTIPTNGVIPKDGKIKVTFPSTFVVTGAGAGTLTGIDGTVVASVSSQTVILTRQNDGTNTTAGAVSVVITGITNGTTGSSTLTLGLATTTTADLALASATSANFTINPNAITTLTCEASGQGGAVWLRWTTTVGTSNGYEAKYAQGNAITYSTATAFTQTWSSGTVSTAQQQLLTGLNPNTQYTFAMKALGTGSSISAISTLTPTCYAPGGSPSVVDTQAPVTRFTYPTTNAYVLAGQPLTIKGVSKDVGGSSVQKVEISLDNGVAWNQANAISNDEGNLIWNYTWAAPTVGAITIKARASDWMGNIETPVSLTINVVNTLPTTTPATPATPAIPGVRPAIPATPASPARAVRHAYGRNLRFGEFDDEVLELQRFLNANGYIIIIFGPGSKGKETKYFGQATKKALMKYQKDHNLPATGFFGPLTRALFNLQFFNKNRL